MTDVRESTPIEVVRTDDGRVAIVTLGAKTEWHAREPEGLVLAPSDAIAFARRLFQVALEIGEGR